MKTQTAISTKFSAIVSKLLLPAAVLSIALVVLSAVVAVAYGPAGRKTFTINSPAPYITFNSIVDNPNHGKEQNFVQIKETSNTSAGGWKDELKVEIGKEYWVRMYVHNNAAKNLKLVAENTRLTAAIPNTTGKSITVTGQVSARNSDPKKVWDEAVFTSDSEFKLAYINGSASWRNNVFTSGTKLSDSIVTTDGALIGYDKLDGRIPGCFEYDGVATFRVVVQAPTKPQYTVEKKVRKSGATEWQKNTTVKLGDTVEYQIGYRNIGNTVQKGVQIFDKLPAGVTYVAGSTTLKNANNPDGNGKSVQDGVTTTGIKIGDYSTGANAFVRFKAKVTAVAKDLKCGKNTLRNFGHATSDGSTQQDSADITVEVECKPDECKPGVPKGDSRCEEKCVPKEGEVVDKDGNCVPAALPTTGPAQMIAGILGIALVSLGVAYWIRSRNEYKKALAGFTEDFTEEPKEELLTARTEDHRDSKHLHK